MESKVNWVTLDGKPLNFTKWHDEATGVTHVRIEREWEPLKILTGSIDEIIHAAVIDLS